MIADAIMRIRRKPSDANASFGFPDKLTRKTNVFRVFMIADAIMRIRRKPSDANASFGFPDKLTRKTKKKNVRSVYEKL